MIIKSGLEMLSGTISQMLGERVESDVSKGVKQTVCSFPEVHGAYDLVLHNYGPDSLIGSVHIEVPDTLTADELDVLERAITQKVYAEHGVMLAGISVSSMNTKKDAAAKLHQDIRRTVMQHDYVLQMHGFYLNEAEKTVQFDVVLDFAAPDQQALYGQILDDVQALCPGYRLIVTPDADLSD